LICTTAGPTLYPAISTGIPNSASLDLISSAFQAIYTSSIGHLSGFGCTNKRTGKLGLSLGNVIIGFGCATISSGDHDPLNLSNNLALSRDFKSAHHADSDDSFLDCSAICL
jgi:hypothetical protein